MHSQWFLQRTSLTNDTLWPDFVWSSGVSQLFESAHKCLMTWLVTFHTPAFKFNAFISPNHSYKMCPYNMKLLCSGETSFEWGGCLRTKWFHGISEVTCWTGWKAQFSKCKLDCSVNEKLTWEKWKWWQRSGLLCSTTNRKRAANESESDTHKITVTRRENSNDREETQMSNWVSQTFHFTSTTYRNINSYCTWLDIHTYIYYLYIYRLGNRTGQLVSLINQDTLSCL